MKIAMFSFNLGANDKNLSKHKRFVNFKLKAQLVFFPILIGISIYSILQDKRLVDEFLVSASASYSQAVVDQCQSSVKNLDGADLFIAQLDQCMREKSKSH